MKNAEKPDVKNDRTKYLENAAKTIFKSGQENLSDAGKSNTTEDEIVKLKDEILKLKKENFNIKTLAALEKSGCLKPELAAKAIPDDCENIQEWVEGFKAENAILFKKPLNNHGSSFKPTQGTNLSPVEIMNNFIRGI